MIFEPLPTDPTATAFSDVSIPLGFAGFAILIIGLLAAATFNKGSIAVFGGVSGGMIIVMAFVSGFFSAGPRTSASQALQEQVEHAYAITLADSQAAALTERPGWNRPIAYERLVDGYPEDEGIVHLGIAEAENINGDTITVHLFWDGDEWQIAEVDTIQPMPAEQEDVD